MPPSNIIISSQTSTLTGKRRRLGNLLWMKTVSRRGKRTRMSQVRKVHRFRRRGPATTQGVEGKVVPGTKEKFPWFPFFCSIVFESPLLTLHPLFRFSQFFVLDGLNSQPFPDGITGDGIPSQRCVFARSTAKISPWWRWCPKPSHKSPAIGTQILQCAAPVMFIGSLVYPLYNPHWLWIYHDISSIIQILAPQL